MKRIMDNLVKELDNKSELESLHIISNIIIPFCHKQSLKYGVDKIFDNYNYRQQQMYGLMKTHWKNVVMSKKRTGKDAWSLESPTLTNIEMKTISNNSSIHPIGLSFPFDKQNDPQRRKETLEYDSFVFGVLYEETLRIMLIAEDPVTINHLNELMKELQTIFVEKWESNIASGKRGGHDAIRICFKNMLIDDYTWHIWIDDVWYKNIHSSQCVVEIDKFHNTLDKPIKEPKKEKTPEEKAAIAAKANATRIANKAMKLLTPM